MVKFEIIKKYLKGLSFKCDLTPAIFFGNDDSQTNLGVDINTQASSSNNDNNEIYDVTLSVVLSPKKSNNVEVFRFEISYSALVVLSLPKNAAEEDIRRTLMIDVPQELMPVVRHIINQEIFSAGFPPVQLSQIDFEELYESKMTNTGALLNDVSENTKAKSELEKLPPLSYESVVSSMLHTKEAFDFVQTCKNNGMEPALDFNETPMYKYLMRFINVPEYKLPNIPGRHVDYWFYISLYQMLMLDNEAKCRFVKDDELEIYVTYKRIQDIPISHMSTDELEFLMESLIINSWVNYNVTLGYLFEEDIQDDADRYLSKFGNQKMITFKEFSKFFSLYANKSLLDREKVKEWHSRLQKIDIESIPYRF